MKEKNLPPYAPLLMESTRALGYSLEAAIADILDNSISAGATKIDIEFRPFDEQPYLSIIDDGCGMTLDELINAMRYGSKNPCDIRCESDLGRFGLGLKTASLSQCRKLTVISFKNGIVSAAKWDLDHVNKTYDWNLLIYEKNEYNNLPNINKLIEQKKGTIVLWQSLDRLGAGEYNFEQTFTDKMCLVRKHLSLVFHRYLTGEPGIKKIEIKINGLKIEPHDPFLISKSTQMMDEEIINIDGRKITVTPYILPHLSKLTAKEIKDIGGNEGLRKQQGFYVYRNKRLLVWGTWFKLHRQDDLSKLARVRVDIPNSLDEYWTLDVKKSVAVPPEIVKNNLKRIVDKITEGSKRTWTFRGRKETSDSCINIWNRFETRDGIKYCINMDYPIIGNLMQMLGEQEQKYLLQIITLIENNIPLNSLYVDLTNDEKFADETENKSTKIKEIMVTLMENCKNNADKREELISILKKTSPFSNYPELIKKIIEESE